MGVWKRQENELEFSLELLRKSAHARRAPYRILPSDFKKSLLVDPYALSSVLRVYPNGLEIGTVRGEYAAHTRWSKFVSIALFIFAGFVAFNLLDSVFTGSFIGTMFSALIAYFCLCVGMVFWRSAMHQVVDDPVLFNRKSRMVYARPYIYGGFFRFWVHGHHGPAVAYRWDDQIRARIYNYVYFRGANLASGGFELALLAIRDGTPSVVEQLIPLGTQANSFDSDQLSLWEHIRQYMEEGGPPLQPGDKLRATDLSRVPEFPLEVLADTGGPALDQEAIDRLVQLKRTPGV